MFSENNPLRSNSTLEGNLWIILEYQYLYFSENWYSITNEYG